MVGGSEERSRLGSSLMGDGEAQLIIVHDPSLYLAIDSAHPWTPVAALRDDDPPIVRPPCTTDGIGLVS